ncbi:MAG: 30S ribosomal protein S2 [Firmicutes bacterium]|nr:30S ribosomal protein S2 [Bacillota bacterium]MCL2770918.1 30S ribosomal protein S2 [Bacillota bacterium]
MSVVSLKQLLEAGVHFGHQTKSWNPKMKPYIFQARNGIHILNLEKTEKLIAEAYNFIREVAAEGKSILFVGTKKQAAKVVEEEAERAGVFYINSRWLGGTLTNFKTIRNSIERLNKIEQQQKTGELNLLTKKEAGKLLKEAEKLKEVLGGIRDMHQLPGALFVVDPNAERIAVLEANKLNIPVVAICDTNCNPDGIKHVIPANDDAISSVKLVASVIANAIIEAQEGKAFVKEETEEAVMPKMTEEDFKEKPKAKK